MKGWFEVFRAGKYPQGDVSEADVEHIARTYDPSWREAPIVIGHPKTDDPAYGWVQGLKAKAGVLLAQFRDVAPALSKAVADRRFSKVSVRILNVPKRGVYLGHVGFLGAALPAVAGLAPITFSDEDGVGVFDVECEFTTAAGEAAEETEMADQHTNEASPGAQDFAAQMEAMRADFERKLSEQQADFEKKAQGREAELQTRILAERQARELADFRHAIEGRVRDGKLAPALAEGVAEFMASLPDDGARALEFAIGDKTEKKTPRAFFLEFLDRLPQAVVFGELAGADSDPGAKRRSDFRNIDTDGVTVDADAAELHKRVGEYQEAHTGVSYGAALAAIEG